ncbi:Uncharacterised protein [uncultured archaeon]|nr:Uncharacterised protein [uncultured archaeon]
MKPSTEDNPRILEWFPDEPHVHISGAFAFWMHDTCGYPMEMLSDAVNEAFKDRPASRQLAVSEAYDAYHHTDYAKKMRERPMLKFDTREAMQAYIEERLKQATPQ